MNDAAAVRDEHRRGQRVVACVIERDGRFLLCKRPAHKRHGGFWEFPGGKTEGAETDEEAARRELLEELGVRLVSASPAQFEIADAGSPYVIAFVPAVIDGEPHCNEHDEHRWASLPEMTELSLAPSDFAFATAIGMSADGQNQS